MRVSLVYRWDDPVGVGRFQMANKIYRNDKFGTHYIWPVWPVRLVALLVALASLVLAAGCSSCTPCAPDQTFVDNPIPVYSCPQPPEFTPFVLLPWPVLGPDPSPDEIKAWYVEVVRVNHLQISGCMSSLATCTSLLDAYRAP